MLIIAWFLLISRMSYDCRYILWHMHGSAFLFACLTCSCHLFCLTEDGQTHSVVPWTKTYWDQLGYYDTTRQPTALHHAAAGVEMRNLTKSSIARQWFLIMKCKLQEKNIQPISDLKMPCLGSQAWFIFFLRIASHFSGWFFSLVVSHLALGTTKLLHLHFASSKSCWSSSGDPRTSWSISLVVLSLYFYRMYS